MAETAPSPFAIYAARPTVRVDGRDEPRVRELMLSMDCCEQEGGLGSLELRLKNLASSRGGSAGLAFEDEEHLKLGSEIVVYGGDEQAPSEIFSGRVTALEASFPRSAPPELTVLAEDAGQRARMSRRSAVHEGVTLRDLASEVAERLGLVPQVDGFEDDIGLQVQLDESDLAFLRRLLRRYDGDLQVVAGELHVAPRAAVRRGELELVLHRQLRCARLTADLAHQATAVTAAGWDAAQGTRVSAESRGRHAGPGAGRTGPSLLEDALGPRSEHAGVLAVGTDAEARAVADAAFDRRARGFVRVEATAEGSPALRVGTHVALSGLSPRFDNSYYVTFARHRFDRERGYETDFLAECAFLGAP